MWKWKKIFKIGLYLLLAIFILLVISINFMMTQYDNDKAIKQHFQQNNHDVDIGMFEYQNQRIRVLKKDNKAFKEENENGNQLIFIHGAPGGLMDFEYFLMDSILNSKYELISIDRLGYGGSDRDIYSSIKAQIDIITAYIRNNKYQNVSIIGHSYGGPIALHVALNLNEISRSVVLLAPVMDPKNEIIFWFSPLCKYVPFKWIFPKSFEIASYEKMSHAEELKELEENLQKVDFPVFHMHGMKDQLAPPINIGYMKELIPNEWLQQNILEGAGHLLPWQNQVEVKAMIEESILN